MSTALTSDRAFNPQEIEVETDRYLSELVKLSTAKKSPVGWVQDLRDSAVKILAVERMPNKRDEEWRFTDLSFLLQINFQLAVEIKLDKGAIDPFILPEATDSRLVFVNGFYAPELSNIAGLTTGIYVGNLSNLPEVYSTKITQYLAQQEGAREVFTALSTAGLTDAAVIWVDPDVIVEKPIHLLFLSVVAESAQFIQPRTLVVAQRNSSLQLIENYAAIAPGCSDTPSDRPYFNNTVTEIWLEENAVINHSRIQRESGDAFHIGKSAISQSKDSRYTCTEINLGAKLFRHNLDIWQTGEQTETYLNGLSAISNEQLSDTHSAVYLSKPHGTTNQLHKCIVDGSARAVFNGKVFVPKAAQLTNAAQLNRNLLLSPKARVDTKPQLQITADNVKCSHGATVSQLEADELFYLRSRGLTENDARYLLIDAFAAEILTRLPVESLRQRLTQCIACRTI
jgi:Fe-S cluster assembly protein SufD